MMSLQSKQILIFLILFTMNFLFAQCPTIDPFNYGTCTGSIGYAWTGDACVLVSGCSAGDDEDLFFDTYEECDIACSQHAALGDMNNDSQINVIDVVVLVNLILDGGEFNIIGDLNFDAASDVLDVVLLVNNILYSNTENRYTWEIINEDILTPKCASCHYEGSFFSETSDLVLTEVVAYSQLLNRNPNNTSAENNGLTLLSDEGGMLGLLLSYFWEKININNEVHFYSEHPQYGEIMPLGGPFLTNGELDFIEDWIWAGAPEIGIVADPLILNDESVYESPEFTPLQLPSMGFQYHIGPFDVYPDTEREFLYYVPPVDGAYYINRVEFAAAPGTHHFIAYLFSDNYFGNEPNPYEYRDIHFPYVEDTVEMFTNIITLQEHTFVTGTQWPTWSYSLPEGVALKVDSDFGLDLNPHYFNYTEETIQGEVYLNLHTSLPQDIEHVAGILQLGRNDIELPPNQETVLTEVFSTSEILQSTNIDPPDEATNMNIFQLFSHAHQLMTRFDILIQHPNGDEELIYTALDYEHPPILNLDPPLVISSGQNIIAKATYYNNTDDWVNFGLFSTDEMMLVFGLVYFD